MFCSNCGKEITDDSSFCPSCGTKIVKLAEITEMSKKANISPKSRLVATLLAFFLGGLGIHRFYVGKIGTGILTILLTCCFGIGCVWALVDFIFILCGSFTDKDGLVISDWKID